MGLQKERDGPFRNTWGITLQQEGTALIHAVYEHVKFDRSPRRQHRLRRRRLYEPVVVLSLLPCIGARTIVAVACILELQSR